MLFLGQVTWAPCDRSIVSYNPLAKYSRLESSWELMTSLPSGSQQGSGQPSPSSPCALWEVSSLSIRAPLSPGPPPTRRHTFCLPPAALLPASTSLSPHTLPCFPPCQFLPDLQGAAQAPSSRKLFLSILVPLALCLQ